ncbi:MAG: HAD family phosphatase [Chloroflexi bacterium]|nr:HAD family phosphatase [Chloroflexota bacterium]
MGYRLIALDVDGTIRSGSNPIAERTRRAIDAARESGAVVTLATGRAYRSAIVNSAALDIDVPISTSQGAYIADPVSGEVFRHCPLTGEMALVTLDKLQEHIGPDDSGTQVVAYYPGIMYVDRMSQWAASYGQRTEIEVRLVSNLREVASEGLTRIVAVGDDADIEALERDIRPLLSMSVLVMRSLPYFCEILHPRGGKEDALGWMCERFGIARSETIAFGNGYNDVQMLEWAGLGIAVGDAVPEALAAADSVAPPFDEHGVAQVLEELLAKGLIG